MKRIYLISRYRGDVARNIQVAKTLCASLCLSANATTDGEDFAPFASHLFYTQFLDDEDPKQRAAGIAAGHAWMAVADEVWVWVHELPLSEGMVGDVYKAIELEKPVIAFSPAIGRRPWLDWTATINPELWLPPSHQP